MYGPISGFNLAPEPQTGQSQKDMSTSYIKTKFYPE